MSEEKRRQSERAAALEAERHRLVEEAKGKAPAILETMVKESLLEDVDADTAIRNAMGTLSQEQQDAVRRYVEETKASPPPVATKPPVTRPSPEQLAASRREPTYDPPPHKTIPSPPPVMSPPHGIPIPSTAYDTSSPAPRLIPGAPTLDKGFPPSGKRLLVVDDDREIRTALRELLAEEGFRVYTAECGFKAIMAITKNPDIDLIILDLMMPNVSGFQFIEWLNASPWAEKPVLIISAGHPSQLEAFEDRYIFTKPLDTDQLLRTVRTAIEAHHR